MKTQKSQNSPHFMKSTSDNSYLRINTLKIVRFHRNNRESQKFNWLIGKKIESHLLIKKHGNPRNSVDVNLHVHIVMSTTSFYSLLLTYYFICEVKIFKETPLLGG